MNKYQKGFAPIVIALVVLILAGVGGTSYYLINKQSKSLNQQNDNIDTSDWKIYTNSDADFEIKYPSNWESPFENWGPSFTAGMSLDNDNLCVIDAMGWLGSNDAEIADLIGKGYIKTSTKIDSIDAIRLTSNPAGAGLTEAVYFEANGKSFRIGRNRGFGDKIEQDCIKNFNQILSSFKFINEELNKDERADWKTYINNKYNYQINYPEDIYTIENITSNPEKGMTDDNVTLYDIKSVQETKKCECGEYTAIHINTYSNPQGLSLENYIKENIKRWAPDYSNLFVNEQTSLNGIPAIKIGTEREQYYVLKKDNIIFSIGGFIDMNVINTFKFTNEEINKDILLNKLIPTLSFKNGIAISSESYRFNLKDSIEDYFINNKEKNLLLVIEGQNADLYLGLFDKNGNLLTNSYNFNSIHSQWGNGRVDYYDCKGIKYILNIDIQCPTGGCCDSFARLLKINNNKFEVVQDITNTDTSFGLIMYPSEDKILIKKVPSISEIGINCPETDYKELRWNNSSCKFE